jgi:hypothetical protein
MDKPARTTEKERANALDRTDGVEEQAGNKRARAATKDTVRKFRFNLCGTTAMHP